MGKVKRRASAHYRKERRTSKPALDTTQNPSPGAVALADHLAVDLAGDLIEVFSKDYQDRGGDRALAELLLSVRDLKTPYDRRAAAAALESLANRIEAGFGEYPTW